MFMFSSNEPVKGTHLQKLTNQPMLNEVKSTLFRVEKKNKKNKNKTAKLLMFKKFFGTIFW